MLDAITRLQTYTYDLDEAAFFGSQLIQDACFRNFLVLGEAVKQIPDDARAKRPEVPWKAIAGLRDHLAHAYFSIDERILWSIVKNDLEPLKAAVLFLLESEAP